MISKAVINKIKDNYLNKPFMPDYDDFSTEEVIKLVVNSIIKLLNDEDEISNNLVYKLDYYTLNRLVTIQEKDTEDYSSEDLGVITEATANLKLLNNLSYKKAKRLVYLALAAGDVTLLFMSVAGRYAFTYKRKGRSGKTYRLVKNDGIIRLWASTTPASLTIREVKQAGLMIEEFYLALDGEAEES